MTLGIAVQIVAAGSRARRTRLHRAQLGDGAKQIDIFQAVGGQYRQPVTLPHANAGQTDVIRNLRAAGIDPNSEQGRTIIMQSIKVRNALFTHKSIDLAAAALEVIPRGVVLQLRRDRGRGEICGRWVHVVVYQ